MRSLILLCLSALPAFSQDPGPFASFDRASEAVLADPHDLAIGPDGRLYVADKFGARIAVLDAETLELIEMLGEGFLPGVHDISFGPGGKIAVAVTGAGAGQSTEGILSRNLRTKHEQKVLSRQLQHQIRQNLPLIGTSGPFSRLPWRRRGCDLRIVG